MNVKLARPRPVDRESSFLVNELFFSTTDMIGNITSGNSVFIRVSQYDKSELIGSPHNIIRHPDMPRIVFKVLWDSLKAKKPVVAYVKNMTKEGLYYWVLASVFPVSRGYLSIRLKPTSEIFNLIAPIYKQLLAAEESGGMEASLKLLLEILQSKGFDDYDSFMSTVLIEELNSRERLIKAQSRGDLSELALSQGQNSDQQGIVDLLNEIRALCTDVFAAFERLSKDFDNLLIVEKTLASTSTSVLNFSDQISILSLNVNINSYFAGESGRTLSVVSKTINVKTEEVEHFTQAIVKCSKDISTYSRKLAFHTSTSRLQIAMINAFIQELYENSLQRKLNADEIMEMRSNILALINLFTNTFSQLASILIPIGGKIKDILGLIDSINSSIYELERCNFLGNIEAAVIGEKGTKFTLTFSEIKDSTEVTKQSLFEFRRYLDSVIGTAKAIERTNTKIADHVSSIKEVVEKLKFVEEPV